MAEKKGATVSVVIPVWNAAGRLARCLEALQAQTRPADQTVVVDNGSGDGTGALVRERYPEVDLVSLARNRGWGGGLNAGLRRAGGSFVATLDSDATPTSTWLQALVTGLEAYPGFDFAASRLLLADGSGRIDSAGDGFDPTAGGVMRGSGQADGPAFDQFREVFSATGAASLYRREVLEAIGGADESLFLYNSDIDMGFRARLLGYRCLYVPTAIAYHQRSATLGRDSAAQIHLVYRNGLTVYLKNMPWPLLRPIWARVLRRWAGMVRHAPHRTAAFRGVLEALIRLPHTLARRRRIQRSRVVDLDRLWAVMEPEGRPV